MYLVEAVIFAHDRRPAVLKSLNFRGNGVDVLDSRKPKSFDELFARVNHLVIYI